MSEKNFYTDPDALDASRDDEVPPGVFGNPLFDDEPSPPPDAPPARETRPARDDDSASPDPEEGQKRAAPKPPPEPASQPSPAPFDYNQLAAAVAAAVRASQPQPQREEKGFEIPEVEIDENAFLEGRSEGALKKAIRDAQVTTAEAVQRHMERAYAPLVQSAQGMLQYQQSRLPVDEWNARQAARSHLVRQGFATEADADDLLDRAAPLIAQSWEHRLNPSGWVGAAQYALLQSGSVPVRDKPKAAEGAGKGDAPAPKSTEPKRKYLSHFRQMNKRRAQEFQEASRG